MTRQIAAADVIGWNPCEDWTPNRVRSFFPDGQRRDVLDVLQIAEISTADKLWILIHAMTHRERVVFACTCSWDALFAEHQTGRPPDMRYWQAVDTTRAWLRGEATTAEVRDAAESACSAAESAESACSAAESAESACSAAYSAYSAASSACSAAYSAYSAAYRACSAAYSAYSAAESAESAAYRAAYSACSAAYSAYRAACSAALNVQLKTAREIITGERSI